MRVRAVLDLRCFATLRPWSGHVGAVKTYVQLFMTEYQEHLVTCYIIDVHNPSI